MKRTASGGPFPPVRRVPAEKPFNLSDAGIWDEVGQHDPEPVVREQADVDADRFLKCTGLEREPSERNELGEGRPLAKRARVTAISELMDQMVTEIAQVIAGLRKLVPAPADDKKLRFKPGERCRMRAGGARCTVVEQRPSGLIEVALVGGGSAYVTSDQLELTPE